MGFWLKSRSERPPARGLKWLYHALRDSSRNGQTTLWLSLVASGEQADTLTDYRKGAIIIVSGGMRSAKRRGKDGKIIRGYQVSADLIEPYPYATMTPPTQPCNCGGISAHKPAHNSGHYGQSPTEGRGG
ncbi:hypothetical protein DS023_14805 [Salmonella enterica]|nr:hypothetical protein [Salmonella enterica]